MIALRLGEEKNQIKDTGLGKGRLRHKGKREKDRREKGITRSYRKK